ncbi:MAG: T9SS type A sorting domain-containing protein [Paludibacter sp.]|nr:T9SS type A sorting domain-containing protein [Paludibacter sp.]
MLKKTYPIIFLFILTLFIASWGSVGHKTINSKCPESFPASMTGFNAWKDSLGTNASNADTRKNADKTESPKHFIDIDIYPEFISTGRIASTYDSIASLHGATYIINNGSLPWATVNMYDTLVVDFKKLKWHKAMLDASDLGHYVGDGHMPLHLTKNYDGGDTGQSGIHSRYESTMVSAYSTALSNYTGDPVHIVSNVNKYVFDYIYYDYQYKDSVLAADTYAKNLTGGTNTAAYTTALWSKTQFTTMLFKNASHALAELIYSAWVEAGNPVFGSKIAPSSLSNALGNTITAYPNPTTGILNLSGDNIFRCELSSLTGSQQGLFYTKQIDLSNLPNGLYILSIYGKEGLMKREKIRILK